MRGQDVKWREYIRKRWVSEKRGGGGDTNIKKKKVTIRTLREESE